MSKETHEYESYEDEYTSSMKHEDRDAMDQDALHMYSQAEVALPIAGETHADGNLMRKFAAYAIFPEGKEYAANVEKCSPCATESVINSFC